MFTPFRCDLAFLAMMLLIPIGIIVVIWIALRKYLETRQIGFLSIALAFMFGPFNMALFSLLSYRLGAVGAPALIATIYLYAGLFVPFFVLIAYGLLKLSSKPERNAQLPSGEKLTLNRQLSLFAGVAMIVAVFYPWIGYEYIYENGSRGGSSFLLDVFLLPSTLKLEQINISALVIGATLGGILLLVAGLGCIAEDAIWSMLGVAGLTSFFFMYVGSPGASLVVATGSTSGFFTGWYMALSIGFILGILGVATGLAAIILSIAPARLACITHMSEKPGV